MCLGRIGNGPNGRLCFETNSLFGHVSYLNWIIFTDPTGIYLHGISLQCRKRVHVAVLHRFTIITDVQSSSLSNLDEPESRRIYLFQFDNSYSWMLDFTITFHHGSTTSFKSCSPFTNYFPSSDCYCFCIS